MNTKQLIEQAISLPIEERTLLLDSLLRSLNHPQSAVDRQWAVEADKRLSELRSGRVEAIPGDEVFARVWKKFEA